MLGVSVFTVHNVFVTWINFCYCQWQKINWWPERRLVQHYCPADFKVSHDNYQSGCRCYRGQGQTAIKSTITKGKFLYLQTQQHSEGASWCYTWWSDALVPCQIQMPRKLRGLTTERGQFPHVTVTVSDSKKKRQDSSLNNSSQCSHLVTIHPPPPPPPPPPRRNTPLGNI